MCIRYIPSASILKNRQNNNNSIFSLSDCQNPQNENKFISHNIEICIYGTRVIYRVFTKQQYLWIENILLMEAWLPHTDHRSEYDDKWGCQLFEVESQKICKKKILFKAVITKIAVG